MPDRKRLCRILEPETRQQLVVRGDDPCPLGFWGTLHQNPRADPASGQVTRVTRNSDNSNLEDRKLPFGPTNAFNWTFGARAQSKSGTAQAPAPRGSPQVPQGPAELPEAELLFPDTGKD